MKATVSSVGNNDIFFFQIEDDLEFTSESIKTKDFRSKLDDSFN